MVVLDNIMDFLEYVERKEGTYTPFMDKISDICAKRSFVMLNIGQNHTGHEIYKIDINPQANKSIAFIAGIHGNEKGGPFGVLHFLSQSYIPDDIRVLVIPLANPYGFEKHIRRDGRRRDQNRQWCKELTDENAMIAGAIQEHKPTILHTLHEDPNEDGFYLYYSDHAKTGIYKNLVQQANQYFPLLSKDEIYGDKVYNGMIPEIDLSKDKHRCCMETYFWKNHNINYLTTETPGKASMKKRAAFNKIAMDWVVANLT